MQFQGKGISDLRRSLGLGQNEFGQLLGVHGMTVSRWERGEYPPSTHQVVLMDAFRKAAREREARETVGKVLVGAGIIAALLLLLKAAQKED